jgi:hypothetical protein
LLLLLLSASVNESPTLETKERGTIDMALENGTYVNSLVPANPASTDGLAQADDHIRLIKSTLKNTFPNLTGPVTATQADLNNTTSIPSSLTDLGITDGTINQVLKTDGSGNFSFFTLPAGTTDTNYYVTGGSVSGSTLTLTREGLGSVSISGLPTAVTNNNQLANGAGYITTQYSQPTTLGAVGTYALMQNHSGSSVSAGGTVSGSSLKYHSINWSETGTPAASGTWRVMGRFAGSGTGTTNAISVCLRIS